MNAGWHLSYTQHRSISRSARAEQALEEPQRPPESTPIRQLGVQNVAVRLADPIHLSPPSPALAPSLLLCLFTHRLYIPSERVFCHVYAHGKWYIDRRRHEHLWLPQYWPRPAGSAAVRQSVHVDSPDVVCEYLGSRHGDVDAGLQEEGEADGGAGAYQGARGR